LTVLGNDTGGTANVKAMTASETKTLLALDNVDNTSDSNKPISSNTQTALDKIDNSTKFYTPTNPQDSDLVLTLTNGLNNGATILIEVPVTLDDDAEDARLSIDGGSTYRTIFNIIGSAAYAGEDIKGLQIRLALDTGNNRYQTMAGEYAAQQAPFVSDINNIGNVTITTVADNQVLAYDNASSKWVNETKTLIDSVTIEGSITDPDPVQWVEQTTGDWEDAYIATKTLTGILATDQPIIDIDLTGLTFANFEAVTNDYALIFRVEASGTNELKFYASDIPSEDLTINVKVVRE
jgi:hypothetical protein